MNISLAWLKTYVDFDLTAAELAHALTMAGLEVEEIGQGTKTTFSGVVIGEILSVERHPNADKLSVCSVRAGDDVVQVVCGAPNVQAGVKAPFAPVGAVLNGNEIRPVTLRGVQSQGMICSARELGLSKDHTGIMILDTKTAGAAGDPFTAANGSDDTTLSIDITPNRPDCLSHIGVAREVSVITGNPLTLPPSGCRETDRSVDEYISIGIEDSDACPRYSARYISGVTVAESPEWLQNRLSSVGIRPINNIVDITNFVLMETGHPLHAFDYREIAGKQIIVRKAKPGEIFTTLDDISRELTSDDLLICDGERPVALAGIMGGKNSEIGDDTTAVLLESAFFDPLTIRKTAKRLGLSTEASQRFERGADPNNTVYAVDRAARLIQELAGGTIAGGVADAYPAPVQPLAVSLRLKRLEAITGISIPADRVRDILTRLQLAPSGSDPLTVTVPTFRPDIKREIDLIEEVLRHFGYNTVPAAETILLPLGDTRNPLRDYTETLKDAAAGAGLHEVVNSSLVPSRYTELYVPEGNVPAGVKNPLNPETAFLRTSLIPGLLTAVSWNINRSHDTCRLFETGNVFSFRDTVSLPDETLTFAGVLYGRSGSSEFWSDEKEQVTFFHLKGLVETLLSRSYLRECRFTAEDHPLFAYGYTITAGDTRLGHFGPVAQSIREQWDIPEAAFCFELSVEHMLAASVPPVSRPISRFPAVKRDVAFIVPGEIPAGDIRACILRAGGAFLKEAALFDQYTGDSIPAGKKSLAFSLQFISPERTLREQDVDPAVKQIIESVGGTFGATLRS
ncbi:phenylalanine--tRNA ligase subunit beta [bacterium]|nr:phenylalanine--tRNA ligase subunit beta [bacterium]